MNLPLAGVQACLAGPRLLRFLCALFDDGSVGILSAPSPDKSATLLQLIRFDVPAMAISCSSDGVVRSAMLFCDTQGMLTTYSIPQVRYSRWRARRCSVCTLCLLVRCRERACSRAQIRHYARDQSERICAGARSCVRTHGDSMSPLSC